MTHPALGTAVASTHGADLPKSKGEDITMLHKIIFLLSSIVGRAARKEYKMNGETRKSRVLDAVTDALISVDIALVGSDRVMADSRKRAIKAREKAIAAGTYERI